MMFKNQSLALLMKNIASCDHAGNAVPADQVDGRSVSILAQYPGKSRLRIDTIFHVYHYTIHNGKPM